MQFLGILGTSFLACAHAYSYVAELNLGQYQGVWYEVYEDLFDETFQKGGRCVKADYTLFENGTVGVLNTEILPNGTEALITGSAYYEDGNDGGITRGNNLARATVSSLSGSCTPTVT